MSLYRAPAYPAPPLAAASRRPAGLWRKLWHFYRKGWNPFVSIGYALPFFFVAMHWYIYGLDPWMAVHAVLLPLFFGLAISNGVTRHKLSLRRRWMRKPPLDAQLDYFARVLEMKWRMQRVAEEARTAGGEERAPAVPGVTIYRG